MEHGMDTRGLQRFIECRVLKFSAFSRSLNPVCGAKFGNCQEYVDSSSAMEFDPILICRKLRNDGD